MKLLYVLPRMSGEGGVQRVIAFKLNYLVTHFDFDIHLVCHDQTPSFYPMYSRIQMHYLTLKGNRWSYFNQYRQGIKDTVAQVKPDVVVVCDGFKGYFLPFFRLNVPLVFEVHGSYYNRIYPSRSWGWRNALYLMELLMKRPLAARFDCLVVLSEMAKKEWKLRSTVVIPNPNWIVPLPRNPQKVALMVARHSYEKGIDRMLPIWAKFIQYHPDWTLQIFGSGSTSSSKALAHQLGILDSVYFEEPTPAITAIYAQSGMFLMTSRFEGLPMALMEAMTCGVPCVAYDCPVGPRALLLSQEHGYLIPEDNSEAFLSAMNEIALDYPNAPHASTAMASVVRFQPETVMKQWVALFESLRSNAKDNTV